MADRTVRVTLSLIASNYNRGMQEVQRSTERATRSAEQRLNAQRQAMEDLGKTGLTVGAVIAAGLAVAVGKFAEFDAAMSNVQAATHETATNMGLLREAAIEAGASTVFSATEAANAIEELSKAGVSTSDILGGALSGSLDLASAGELGVAQAAEIAATAMTQFGLAGSQVPHIADLLAAGAGKAQGSVEDLSNALNQGGLVASQTGLTIEETTGGLAAFAAAGLTGSDAGTSFKSMLQRLTPQSKEAQRAMDELGISAYDSQGNFIGLEAFAGNLKTSLADLTVEQRNSALATIFGSDAVRAASVLYNQGAEGIGNWIDNVDDTGYAAETARIKLDNLKGDVEALGGAFDTALINSGSSANDTLRFLTQTATTLVTTIGNLPGPVLAVGVGVTALVGGVALLGGGFLTLVPRIAATRLAMQELNLTAGSVAKGFGKGGAILLGLTAITTGLAGLGATSELSADQLAKLNTAFDTKSFEDLDKLFNGGGGFGAAAGGPFDALSADVNGLGGALNSLTSGMGKFSGGFGKFIDGATFGLTHLSDTSKRFESQFKSLGVSLSSTADSDFTAATDGFKQLVEQAGGGEEAVAKLLEVMPEYKAKLIELAGAQGQNLSDQELYNLALGEGTIAAQLARDSSARQAEGLAELSGVAEDAQVDIEDLSDAIKEFGSAEFDVRSATREFESAVDDLAESVTNNGDSLDVATEKGRANEAALDGLASSALELASATLAQTGSQDAASAALEGGRQKLIEALGQFGITGQAAQDYADKLGLIPSNITTAAQLTGVDAAQSKIDNLVRLNNGRIVRISVQATNDSPAGSWTGGIPRATGGAIYGPGTGTSDTAGLYRLSNGEHVLTAAEVIAMGGQSAVYSFRNQLKAGLAGYANGGAVQYMKSAPRAPMARGRGGSGAAAISQTFNLAPGLTASEVARISAAERDFEMRSN